MCGVAGYSCAPSTRNKPRMNAFFRLARQTALAAALYSAASLAGAASPVHKCVVDGQVIFQGSPCASGNPSRQPTVDELNAERKKRLKTAQPALASSAPSSFAASTPSTGARPTTSAADAPTFSCDGRQHCSQMRSCSEAKYFLAHCPGTKWTATAMAFPVKSSGALIPLPGSS